MTRTKNIASVKAFVVAAIIAGVIGATIPASAAPAGNPRPCKQTQSCFNEYRQNPGGGKKTVTDHIS